MLEERERACDERVLDDGHDGARLRVRNPRGVPPLPRRRVVSAAATSGDLTQRVRYILGDARPRSLGASRPWRCWLRLLASRPHRCSPAPSMAGAHRRELLAVNSRALGSAEFSIAPRRERRRHTPQRIIAAPDEVVIRNTSLRDLIAHSPTAWNAGRWWHGPVARFAPLRHARADARFRERSRGARPPARCRRR